MKRFLGVLVAVGALAIAGAAVAQMEHGSGHDTHGAMGDANKTGHEMNCPMGKAGREMESNMSKAGHEMMKNHMSRAGHDRKSHMGTAGHE